MKKKQTQRHSYKKLIPQNSGYHSTSGSQQQYLTKNITPNQHPHSTKNQSSNHYQPIHNHQNTNAKSAEKVLAIYESATGGGTGTQGNNPNTGTTKFKINTNMSGSGTGGSSSQQQQPQQHGKYPSFPQRIRTQTDQCQKTKTNSTHIGKGIDSGRGGGRGQNKQKEKEKEKRVALSHGKYENPHQSQPQQPLHKRQSPSSLGLYKEKQINSNRCRIGQRSGGGVGNFMMMTGNEKDKDKHAMYQTKTKKLGHGNSAIGTGIGGHLNGGSGNNKSKKSPYHLRLNSEIFADNALRHSLERSYESGIDGPQTGKHSSTRNGKKNYSFRKSPTAGGSGGGVAYDSYRGNNGSSGVEKVEKGKGKQKTALEKYISESLENLDCPPSKKKGSSSSKGLVRKGDATKTANKIILGDLSSSKEKKKLKLGLPKDKSFFVDKRSGRGEKGRQELEQEDYLREEESSLNNSQEKPRRQNPSDRTVKNPNPQKSISSARKVHEANEIEKIEIKWEKKKKNPYDLSLEEATTFGDRFPDGFQKLKLLGRGGFSLVWLGQHKKSKKKYAIKQIITQSNHQTHIKEIWFGTYFFQFGGAPKQEFRSEIGITNLVKLYYYFINKKDTWILYEKCGDSLGNTLYELKGQQYHGQKMYRIHYKSFYNDLRNDQRYLRKIIKEVAKALALLSQNNIVHSDLKTENILIKMKGEKQSSGGEEKGQKDEFVGGGEEESQAKTVHARKSGRSHSRRNQPSHSPLIHQHPPPTSPQIQQIKLIDYGSSFVFNNLRQFSMATPQYMAPQILNFILYENQLEYIPKLLQYVQQYDNPWVIDVWSLGSVVLQIISGIPLWMSLKTIVRQPGGIASGYSKDDSKGKQVIKTGLFAIKGRTFDKIIKKQLQVIQTLDRYLDEENYSGIVLENDLRHLLKRMLCLNPANRISPMEIIQFLEEMQEQEVGIEGVEVQGMKGRGVGVNNRYNRQRESYEEEEGDEFQVRGGSGQEMRRSN